MFARIAREAGPGQHDITLALVDDAGMTALHHVGFRECGEGVEIAPTDLIDVCYMLAVGLSGKHRGGFFMRSNRDGQESICGWRWADGEPCPLTEAETFDAYCTDPATGDLFGPEPGIEYRDAPVICV
ncbi:hypothetical protein [Streptomyces sp. NPDC047803]|uniref:hypothetical protein n=1 Tax=unclassified Streptomyces TaxID=2593676 RepID=UPI0034046DCC